MIINRIQAKEILAREQANNTDNLWPAFLSTQSLKII